MNIDEIIGHTANAIIHHFNPRIYGIGDVTHVIDEHGRMVVKMVVVGHCREESTVTSIIPKRCLDEEDQDIETIGNILFNHKGGIYTANKAIKLVGEVLTKARVPQ